LIEAFWLSEVALGGCATTDVRGSGGVGRELNAEGLHDAKKC
jgi:hypothetical protein